MLHKSNLIIEIYVIVYCCIQSEYCSSEICKHCYEQCIFCEEFAVKTKDTVNKTHSVGVCANRFICLMHTTNFQIDTSRV